MRRVPIVTGCSAVLGLLFAGVAAHVVSASLPAQTAATGEVLSLKVTARPAT